MGILNLLPQLKSIVKQRRLEYYRGKRVGVDVMCWLHRGCKSCAREIILYNDSSKLVQFVMIRLNELISAGITPIVVFDGDDLPNKQITNNRRQEWEEQYVATAKQLEKEGNIIEARDYYYHAIDITADLYVPLIQQLRQFQINYIVAPYESDAELGFLSRNNYVDFVISEDGDSLVYGCRCVLFKLENGVGDEISMTRFSDCTELDFCHWTHDMFLYMCILCGCDYVKRIKGLGVSTAYSIVNVAKTPTSIFDMIRTRFAIPEGYEEAFSRAVFTFRHQTIYDPASRQSAPLLPYPATLFASPPEFLGHLLSPTKAVAIAEGTLHPVTHLPLTPSTQPSEQPSTQPSAMEEEPALRGMPRFSSPFISISFKALLETPSQRGLPIEGHLDLGSAPSQKRNIGCIVAESPPLKRSINVVAESPVGNRSSVFLDDFRCNLQKNFSSYSVCCTLPYPLLSYTFRNPHIGEMSKLCAFRIHLTS